MKRIIFFAFLFFPVLSFSQDIIHRKNGDRIECEISEVGTEQVKYSRLMKPKPVFLINKKDILAIEHENGESETFKIIDDKKNRRFIYRPKVYYHELPAFTNKKKINILLKDNRITPQGRSKIKINSFELLKIIETMLTAKGKPDLIKFVRSLEEITKGESYVLLFLEAYDSIYYPSYWHSNTRYFFESWNGKRKDFREIETTHGYYNALGLIHAKKTQSKCLKESTIKLINTINNIRF